MVAIVHRSAATLSRSILLRLTWGRNTDYDFFPSWPVREGSLFSNIFSLVAELLGIWDTSVDVGIITSFVSFLFHQISRFKMAISLEIVLVSVGKYLLKGE